MHFNPESVPKILIMACVCWICVSKSGIFILFSAKSAAHFAAFRERYAARVLRLFGKYPFLGQLLIWGFRENISS
jgi:hypothetical protein